MAAAVVTRMTSGFLEMLWEFVLWLEQCHVLVTA